MCAKGRNPVFDARLALKVSQEISKDDAIDSDDGQERGNHLKARISRTLGAAVKTAVRANAKTVDGNRANIRPRYTFTYLLTRGSVAA